MLIQTTAYLQSRRNNWVRRSLLKFLSIKDIDEFILTSCLARFPGHLPEDESVNNNNDD